MEMNLTKTAQHYNGIIELLAILTPIITQTRGLRHENRPE
jgi:hypothetical protein